MTDINPYQELTYQPEQITEFINNGNEYKGYAADLFREIDTHFSAYEELYDDAVEKKFDEGVYLDAELFDKAKAELEIANKIMERLVIDLQNRDGAYGVQNCEIVYEGDDN